VGASADHNALGSHFLIASAVKAIAGDAVTTDAIGLEPEAFIFPERERPDLVRQPYKS